jgi:hypothetical protein
LKGLGSDIVIIDSSRCASLSLAKLSALPRRPLLENSVGVVLSLFFAGTAAHIEGGLVALLLTAIRVVIVKYLDVLVLLLGWLFGLLIF